MAYSYSLSCIVVMAELLQTIVWPAIYMSLPPSLTCQVRIIHLLHLLLQHMRCTHKFG